MKIASVFAFTLLLYITTDIQAMGSGPGIAKTKHNLSPSGLEEDDEQICYWCHTPHMTYGSDAEGPAWGKGAPGGSFQMYGKTPTGEKNMDTGEDIMASSSSVLVCLGCHDGINAPNRIIRIPKASDDDLTGLDPLASSMAVSQVSRHVDHPVEHPVFVTYKAGGKARLRDPNTNLLTASGTEWGRSKFIRDLLRDGRVECVSCHDPHVEKEVFLRAESGGSSSKLCFGCHNK